MHVNSLWPEMATIVQGRSASTLMTVLATQPFAGWNVAERYSDGSHLTPAAVAAHVTAARTVVGILAQAHIDGALS
ncbi:hypothetical protein UO65_3978 [Actinokineospora spheciospongiae]|uniref:Uncharacterized protein n=2 Tax=Actinokineospora spheciospongiae TaxID=909613 RepID=W7IIX4_9PSEU|nr:hypothetical protein UO65_3978 [Actinokineospora spheciospongiae]